MALPLDETIAAGQTAHIADHQTIASVINDRLDYDRTGAAAAARLVGGHATVAPTTGTHALGDFVVISTGKMAICTVAGTPGTWVVLAPSTTIISESVLAGGEASVDITSIPATYRHLRLVVIGRGDTAALATNLLLRYNNDSAANYDWVLSSYQGASGSGSTQAAAQTAARVGTLLAASATAGDPTLADVFIPAYAGTTFRKVSSTVQNLGNGTNTMGADQLSAKWNSTAAINRITLLPAAGNFAAGTTVTLYGIAAA